MDTDLFGGMDLSQPWLRAVGFMFIVISIVAALYRALSSDEMENRIKRFAIERERVRSRIRRTSAPEIIGLRAQERKFVRQIVDRFSLHTWLGAENARLKLAMAGYRSPTAESMLLFARFVSPLIAVLLVVMIMYSRNEDGLTLIHKLLIGSIGFYVGLKAPEIYIRNVTIKRQGSMRRALPDALDLLLISVESGMSIEHALRRVGCEIGVQSRELAEEFAVTTAELSYLPERKQAYANLGMRSGLDGLKQVMSGLIQAEKYGTPMGEALRVAAREVRDTRMNEAEKKAAALSAKLAVPMILFFLPPLLAVILAPAIIRIASGFSSF
jgi:tight adherence protein C